MIEMMPFEWNDRMRLRERDEDLLCGTMCSDVSLKTHGGSLAHVKRGKENRKVGWTLYVCLTT